MSKNPTRRPLEILLALSPPQNLNPPLQVLPLLRLVAATTDVTYSALLQLIAVATDGTYCAHLRLIATATDGVYSALLDLMARWRL